MFLFAILFGILLHNAYPETLLFRRAFFVPAHLNFIYLDFFSKNEFILWANGILKHFVTYPYSSDYPYIVGKYVGYPRMYANTGFLASGFAMFGVMGIILYSFISIILMNTINQFAKQKGKYITMIILFVPLHTLFVSSDLLVTLLTHGLIIGIVFLYLYNNKTYIINIYRYKLKI